MTADQPNAIIVMGVSGSGKSTLGGMLAAELRCPFLEGDMFHDDANVAKMRSGRPLDDADRWPWLDTLGAAAAAAIEARGKVVVACSALKRSYRERLSAAIGAPVLVVLLDATADELERRIGNRPGHYMPQSLLKSQLQTLERPEANERALMLDAETPIRKQCDQVYAFMAQISTGARQRQSS